PTSGACGSAGVKPRRVWSARRVPSFADAGLFLRYRCHNVCNAHGFQWAKVLESGLVRSGHVGYSSLELGSDAKPRQASGIEARSGEAGAVICAEKATGGD